MSNKKLKQKYLIILYSYLIKLEAIKKSIRLNNFFFYLKLDKIFGIEKYKILSN